MSERLKSGAAIAAAYGDAFDAALVAALAEYRAAMRLTPAALDAVRDEPVMPDPTCPTCARYGYDPRLGCHDCMTPEEHARACLERIAAAPLDEERRRLLLQGAEAFLPIQQEVA